jgi:hypothetical protein
MAKLLRKNGLEYNGTCQKIDTDIQDSSVIYDVRLVARCLNCFTLNLLSIMETVRVQVNFCFSFEYDHMI